MKKSKQFGGIMATNMRNISADNSWQHEEDAHALAKAAEIKADPKRHLNAKKAAIKLAAERMLGVKAMKKVATVNVKPLITIGKKK